MVKKSLSVSAVIPVYNGEAYLRQTIESVINQTLPPDEILIIDDGSTDQTLSLAHQMAASNRLIRAFTLPVNCGVSAARNHGCQFAKSEWILFMDADDWAESRLLAGHAESLNGFENHWGGQAVLAYSAYRVMDESGELISGIYRSKAVEPGEILGYELVRNALLTTSGVLVRRDSFLQAGGFDQTIRYAEDYDLWLRLARLGGFAYIDQPLVRVRRHSRNVSKDLGKMLEGEKTVLNRYPPDFIGQAIDKRKLPAKVNSADFASVLFKIDRWEEGLQKITKVVAEDPDYPTGHFLAGIYSIHCHQFADAKVSFEKTLTLDQNHGAALNNLGALLLIEGAPEKAQALLEKAIILHPGYRDARSNLELLANHGTPGDHSAHFTWRELRPVLLSY
jgi:glycosyltransferase involved in cell wall biosynthesis